jgi:hypothetical protein
MSYQTYIPDEWREKHKREQAEAAKAEAARTVGKQQRTARWKKALHTASRIMGWVIVSLVAILVVTVGLLIATGARRR